MFAKKSESEKAQKKEDVTATLQTLKLEKDQQSKPKKKWWQIALRVLFFPFVGLGWLFRFFYRTINLPLTVKMTIVYTLMFSIVLVGFSAFFVSSVRAQLPVTDASEYYIKNLITTIIMLDVVFFMLFASLGALSSQIMLKPIRTITKQIDAITGDDLTARIKEVDSQDELRALTNQINGMLENLEQSFNRQQNFVSDASHELKTPIAVIQGYANLLKRWGKEREEILDEGIEAIARESENMKRIVEQLLLLARLGAMSMAITKVNLYDSLNEMVEDYKMVDKRHTLSFSCKKDIVVMSDKNLLLESVRTLIDNAIKYTPENGRIRVGCELEESAVVIKVADSGIGISQEDIPHIFERFYRCDKARGREKGGSGLGLTIAKTIVESLNGKISASSVEGNGSVFMIHLPV